MQRITKEGLSKKKCCLYASDYHLEMILLPYIEKKIDELDFVIMTEKDLSKSIELLISRITLKDERKNKILNLNWEYNDIEKIEYIKKSENKKINVIINGSVDYIKRINDEIDLLENNNIEIVNCFYIGDKKVKIEDIKSNYKEFINTSKI